MSSTRLAITFVCASALAAGVAHAQKLITGGGLLRAHERGGAPAPLAVTHQRSNDPRLAFQQPGAAAATQSSFDGVLADVETAQVQLVNGHPDAFKALWSHSDNVTLSGGLGGAIAKGWAEVSARLDWVATQYVDGARTHHEVARYVGQDVAYVVLRESIRYKAPADRKSMVQELRVTEVFQREGGRWRIVHRHADAQVAQVMNR